MPPETTSRRFPPPWTIEETAPCFIVRDHNEQALAFVYCEDEPGRRTTGKLLTRDEAKPMIYRRPRTILNSLDFQACN